MQITSGPAWTLPSESVFPGKRRYLPGSSSSPGASGGRCRCWHAKSEGEDALEPRLGPPILTHPAGYGRALFPTSMAARCEGTLVLASTIQGGRRTQRRS